MTPPTAYSICSKIWMRLVCVVSTAALSSLMLNLASAQTRSLSGSLFDSDGQSLVGATVKRIADGTGEVTDEEGRWELEVSSIDSLQFNYVGYSPRTLAVSELSNGDIITLDLRSLDVVTVTGRQKGTYASTIDPRNIESITRTELERAPCCNLGESFETNAAVDVSYRDAATGSREIQVLGLRGIYSQLLVEKRPTLSGLATAQALDYVPGTWLEGIQIGKGASSVQTGANALSGQINTELSKPFDSDPLFVNLFASWFGRVEANVQGAKAWNDQHYTGLLLHGSHNAASHDRDGDGFYEQPGRDTYTALLRHFVRTENWRLQGNLWGTRDRRLGGQTDHAGAEGEHGAHHGGERYTLVQENNRLEGFAKAGYLGFSRPATSAGLIASTTLHQLNNRYGSVDHAATQHSSYVNALFTSYLGSTAHTYTVGVTQQYDRYDERYDDQDYDRTEVVHGAYGEYVYDFTGATSGTLYGASVIAGLRVDHHNLGGYQVLPRLNLKVNPTENLAVRASAGRAYRTTQALAENIRLLASNRTFVIPEPLDLTSGWNYGVALTQNFELGSPSGSSTSSPGEHQITGQWSIDLYATVFDRFALVDQDLAVGITTVTMSEAPAQTLAALASISVEVAPRLELRSALKYVDSRETYRDGVERSTPYVPTWRGLLAASYELPSTRWRFDGNVQIIGKQRLPGEQAFTVQGLDNLDGIRFKSPAFVLANFQTTFVVSDLLEVYAGAENLTNYRQQNPIVGAANDADIDYFDASRIYAPLMGVQPYVGLRYTMAP